MSIWQGFIFLVVLFFILLWLSFKKDFRYKKVARAIAAVLGVLLLSIFMLFKSEFDSSKGCNKSYDGFYMAESLCYGKENLSSGFLKNKGVEVLSVMSLAETSAIIETKGQRYLVIFKEDGNYVLMPYTPQ